MSVAEERFDLEVLREAKRYQRWVLDAFGAYLGSEVLEVGAGIGNFTRWMGARSDHVVVVEPEPLMCEELEALNLPNVEVRQQRLDDLDGAEARFDAVVLYNVLEHLTDDMEALRISYRLLRRGGHACVLVPAHPVLYGSLDARYGHLRRYRLRTVRSALKAAGFTDVEARYFNPMGALGWFLVARVGRRPRLSPWTVKLSENVGVPVGRALDRLFPLPFGQSVLAAGRRP